MRVAIMESESYPWLGKALQLEAAGQGEESLDIIFGTLDDWLLASDFVACSSFLGQLQVDPLSTAQLLTILSATWRAKTELPEWAPFFARVQAKLRGRGEDTDVLLSGFGVDWDRWHDLLDIKDCRAFTSDEHPYC